MTDINHRTTILDASSVTPPHPDPKAPPLPDSGVLDRESYVSLEMPRLFDAVNRTKTRIGSAVLLRTLANPLTQPEEIKAKQETLQGLRENPELRTQLQRYMDGLARLEPSLYQLLFGTFLGMFGSKANEMEVEGFGYEAYIRGTQFVTLAVTGAHTIKPTGLTYLDNVLNAIRAFQETRGYRLARGPVFRTEKGIITLEEKRWWTPCVRFVPSLFKPMWLLAFGVLILALGEFLPFLLDIVAEIIGAFWVFLFPLVLIYIPIVGAFDRDGCVYPFRDSLRKAPELHHLLDHLGQLDELIAFDAYAETVGHPTVLPTIKNGKQHSLKFKGARNPILAPESPNYVGNDIDLSKARLTLITGPNSGGKTAFCKTLAQTQVLAQAGAYVVAEEAEITIADRIFHQAPEISQLADGEGRFGTELRRTKAIFMSATPKSLVIMDELSEGTTHEEKIEISMNILDGFAKKGGSTLLITHNHALVDQYADRPEALTRQVEFATGKPTFRLVPGISRVSHADQVAARIGFSKADIDRHLAGEAKPKKSSKPKSV